GGSWISTGAYGSRFARIAFRRHFYQLCGFRLAKSKDLEAELPAKAVNTGVYIVGAGEEENKNSQENCAQKVAWEPSSNTAYQFDTTETLEGILELEFGFRDSLAAAVARFCSNYCTCNNISTKSVVHIGAATGRTAFELSKTFEHVLGLEPFARLIDTAIKLQGGETVVLKNGQPVQMDPEYQLDKINLKQFTWVANEVDIHDLVLLTHLDRVQNAKAWFLRLWEIVNLKGIVAVVSRDDMWNKKSLNTELNDRLEFVTEQKLVFLDTKGKGSASITLWRRKE
ncbi:hypothetical protein EGW08_016849, partial [Elysia chlorotica]